MGRFVPTVPPPQAKDRPPSTPTWTSDEEHPLERHRRARTFRRICIVAITAVVLLGLSGTLGVRTGSVTDSADGWDLTVRYGRVTRPALATVWEIEVSKEGGFPGPVELATTADYLDLFDENGLSPEPSSEVVDGDMIVWEFDPPEGDTLIISYDARVEPGVQWGKKARTELRLDGELVTAVDYTTTVLP